MVQLFTMKYIQFSDRPWCVILFATAGTGRGVLPYPILSTVEKNRLWKLVLKKAAIYRSRDDEITIRIYPNLPK